MGAPSDDLRRQLGFLDGAAIYVGIILGSGIFVAPAAVAAASSGLATAAGLWILGGLVAACGALCYAECGARLPRTGGFYVFYREALGPSFAFVGGWAAVLVTYPASLAAIAVVFARYLGEVVPLGKAETGAAAAALLAAGALNALGVRIGAAAQRILAGIKVSALAILCAAAVLAPGSPRPHPVAPAGLVIGWTALVGALVVLLWTYDGWSDVTLVSGELVDPARNLRRTVLLGTGVLVAVYAAVQMAVGILLGPQGAAASERVVSDAVQAGLGARSGRLVALLVVVCTFGSVNGTVLTASRLGFAMARDGAFPRWFRKVHGRWATPARSIWGLVAVSIAYALTASFANLLAFFSFSVWIFYGLTAVVLLRLRRRNVGQPTAWRVPGGGVAPVVVLLTAAGVTSMLMVENPRRSMIGLMVLAVGFPAYAAWKKWRPS